MCLGPVLQFTSTTFMPCLLGTTWQAPLVQELTEYVSQHLLVDPQIHTVHYANEYNVQCEPREVNNVLTIAPAILWALKKVPSLCLLVLHLAPMEKPLYGIMSSYAALHLQHTTVPLRDGQPKTNKPPLKPNGLPSSRDLWASKS